MGKSLRLKEVKLEKREIYKSQMKDKIKDCGDTKVSINEMVLPNHTNNLNT